MASLIGAAFQRNAFQNNAFQIGELERTGGGGGEREIIEQHFASHGHGLSDSARELLDRIFSPVEAQEFTAMQVANPLMQSEININKNNNIAALIIILSEV